MSQSPYAGSMSPSGFEAMPPARTSVLAVLAVVVAILCVPGTGLLAILLGAIALTVIGRSRGALEGRGAAISGIILGLITTVLWGAAFMGTLQVWTYYTKNMVPTADRFFKAAAVGDYDGARDELSANAAEELSDVQIAWFIEEVESREGEILGAATSFRTTIDAFGEVFGQSGGSGKPNNSGVDIKSDGNDAIIPIAVNCSNGSILAWLIFDEDTLGGTGATSPKLVDMFVLFSSGEIIALRHDGPALEIAEDSGMDRENAAPPEAPETDGFPSPDPPRSGDEPAPTS